jgi:succinate dehydrogenase / fumarate reductase membrane anchor subunit
MDYQSPLAKVRGLGSAKAGTHHWWLQRMTAVALIPLSFWPIILLDLSLNGSYQETVNWLALPLNSICMVFWILSVFYHAALGLQVVIEDYVSSEKWRIATILSTNLIFLFLMLAAIIAVLRIILAG